MLLPAPSIRPTPASLFSPSGLRLAQSFALVWNGFVNCHSKAFSARRFVYVEQLHTHGWCVIATERQRPHVSAVGTSLMLSASMSGRLDICAARLIKVQILAAMDYKREDKYFAFACVHLRDATCCPLWGFIFGLPRTLPCMWAASMDVPSVHGWATCFRGWPFCDKSRPAFHLHHGTRPSLDCVFEFQVSRVACAKSFTRSDQKTFILNDSVAYASNTCASTNGLSLQSRCTFPNSGLTLFQ
jgi:hypothetical protein